MCVCVCVCVSACVCLCICVCVHTHTFTYACSVKLTHVKYEIMYVYTCDCLFTTLTVIIFISYAKYIGVEVPISTAQPVCWLSMFTSPINTTNYHPAQPHLPTYLLQPGLLLTTMSVTVASTAVISPSPPTLVMSRALHPKG